MSEQLGCARPHIPDSPVRRRATLGGVAHHVEGRPPPNEGRRLQQRLLVEGEKWECRVHGGRRERGMGNEGAPLSLSYTPPCGSMFVPNKHLLSAVQTRTLVPELAKPRALAAIDYQDHIRSRQHAVGGVRHRHGVPRRRSAVVFLKPEMRCRVIVAVTGHLGVLISQPPPLVPLTRRFQAFPYIVDVDFVDFATTRMLVMPECLLHP